MHKEESDNKINEKNSSENNIINTKAKPPKEKKVSQKNTSSPKKPKKKIHFSNSKEKDKDTGPKNNIIKLIEEKKNDKTEETAIPPMHNSEQKNNIDEPQNTLSNLKENKEKRIWKSWSPQEKFLFYEIIANGGNYSSLQKLFKKINDVSI